MPYVDERAAEELFRQKVLALATLEPDLAAGVLSRWYAPTMSPKGQRLLEEALALSAQERTDLAATLLDSLDESEDEGVEDAWSEEIKRRVEDVESGNVKTVPWSEARKRIPVSANLPAIEK